MKTPQTIRCICIGAVALASALTSNAHPYASGETNIGGTVSYYLNEVPTSAWVIFDDGSSNAVVSPHVGQNSFTLTPHNSYSIYVYKAGSGTPSQISVDTNQFNLWPTPRGVAANFDPTNGLTFGRVYVDSSGAGSSTVIYNGVTNVFTKTKGLYMLNGDLSGVNGNVGLAQTPFANSGTSGPYRCSCAPDGSLIVADYSTSYGTIWRFGPNIEYTQQLLAVIGATQGSADGIHGDYFSEPFVSGSLAGGDFTLWAADSTLGINTGTLGGNTVLGYGAANGSYNAVYKYSIGAGPIPSTGWSNAPNLAIGLGLSSYGADQILIDSDVGRVTGNVYGMMERFNYAVPSLQIFDPTGQTLLWDSITADGGSVNSGPDFFNPSSLTYYTNSTVFGAPSGNAGTYGAGVVGAFAVKVSPDERYVAIALVNNTVGVMNLINGIPDAASLTQILNPPNDTAHEDLRGVTWDAADNLYTVSSGQGLLREFSLGLTTTCITTNDATSTNGSFQLVLPPVQADVTVTTSVGSQNYGSPIPAVFTINLNTNYLPNPVNVLLSLGGTAVNGVNYTANFTNGILTIPAGTYPSGNWSSNVLITPTATPVVGPTLSVTLTILGGSPSYLPITPQTATVYIANTGPQTFTVTASSETSMYRGITNDYAEFTITRTGDTNGPSGNNITLTNFVYAGTAVFGTDYINGAQPVPTSATGLLTLGNMGVTFKPGDVVKTVAIGGPVPTPYGSAVGNKTIIISFSSTSGTSSEGYTFTATTNTETLTIIDNGTGIEHVLWSDPLTNATDSTNWTLTFASTNLNPTKTVLPTLYSNYQNNFSGAFGENNYTNDNNGTNDFDAEFGYDLANDGIGYSPMMNSYGWTNALKVSVNKDPALHNGIFGSSAGVNLFPQGVNFSGNFAFRFQMKLVEGNYDSSEYALFGINSAGTNCNWTSGDLKSGVGSQYTNQDGFWEIVTSDAGGGTGGYPPDYAIYTSAGLPNAGYVEPASAFGVAGLYPNTYKHPLPYNATSKGTPADEAGVGFPLNTWVDVEIDQVYSSGTNVTITYLLNKTTNFTFVNTGHTNVFTNGTVMLGYDDPFADTGVGSGAAAYYSGARVVELSPAITNQPVSLVVNAGQPASFLVGAIGSGPFTNTWYQGTNVVQTDVSSASPNSDVDTLSFAATVSSNAGTYTVAVSDAAGKSTSSPFTLTVDSGPVITTVPTNVTIYAGGNVTFKGAASGLPTPTYQWSSNSVKLANGGNVTGVTTTALSLTSVVVADSGTYSILASNSVSTASASAVLVVLPPPPSDITNFFATNATVVMKFYSPDPYDKTNSFTLQGSTNLAVTNPPEGFTNITTTTNFSVSGTNFTVAVPTNAVGPVKFFRIKHN